MSGVRVADTRRAQVREQPREGLWIAPVDRRIAQRCERQVRDHEPAGERGRKARGEKAWPAAHRTRGEDAREQQHGAEAGRDVQAKPESDHGARAARGGAAALCVDRGECHGRECERVHLDAERRPEEREPRQQRRARYARADEARPHVGDAEAACEPIA